MGKYDHPSSGDLEHMKFLFDAPERPDWIFHEKNDTWERCENLRAYIEWLEWRVDDLAAHNRINGDSKEYYIAKCRALEAELKKMTKKGLDGK